MGIQLRAIQTDGYRGAPSGNEYIPPGEYLVAESQDLPAGVLARALAQYMVAIGKAIVVDAPPPDLDPGVSNETPGEAHWPDTSAEGVLPEALGDLSFEELRGIAGSLEIPGRSKMNKDELVQAISAWPSATAGVSFETPEGNEQAHEIPGANSD